MEGEKASDLFLKAGQPPLLRVNNRVVPVREASPLTVEEIREATEIILDRDQREEFAGTKEMDISYAVKDGSRFRINIFFQKGEPAIVARKVKKEIPGFSELNLPVDSLERLSLLPRGLILVAGAAGAGKSTTLAAMIDFISKNRDAHIVTIEDPVEFHFEDNKSIVSQREIGFDAVDFAGALKHVVRQSPDVIMIGEMRDTESMVSAIQIAEVGHLVLSSLHAMNAVQALERIFGFFPPHQLQQIRIQLAFTLQGVIVQRLLPRKGGDGLIPACEILVNTPTVRKLIMEGNTSDIFQSIEDGETFGMLSFNQSILKLYQDGKIGYDTAISASDKPALLELAMKGIFTGRDTFRTGKQ